MTPTKTLRPPPPPFYILNVRSLTKGSPPNFASHIKRILANLLASVFPEYKLIKLLNPNKADPPSYLISI